MGAASAQEQEAAAPVPPGPIFPRTLVTTVVGETGVSEKCWAMPDSLEGDLHYVSAGGRFSADPKSSVDPTLLDPRWSDGAERVLVPGVTVDALALPKSTEISQLWP